MATSTTSLTDFQQTYSETGYVVAKKVFSGASLAFLRDSLRAVLDKSGNPEAERGLSLDEVIMRREAQDHSLVYQASQSVGSSAATYNLLGSSEIFDRIKDATGFEKHDLHLLPMYLIIQLPSDERFDYVWHQDGTYYPWCKDFLTLWFPVNRSVTRETGTISVIPGSHMNGPRDTETTYRNGFFKQMHSKLEPGEAELETMIEIELGDCCIMAGNEVHRSVANRGTTPRVAAVLRMANVGTMSTYHRESFYCVHKS